MSGALYSNSNPPFRRRFTRRNLTTNGSVFGVVALTTGCSGATPCYINAGKEDFIEYISTGSIKWRNTIHISFEVRESGSDPSINIFRILDSVQRGEGFFKGKAIELLNQPFIIIGSLIGTGFAPVELGAIKRDPHLATVSFSTATDPRTLSDLPLDAHSLPSLVQAKPADDYRWKIDVAGQLSYSDFEARTITGAMVADIHVEQRRGLNWGIPDGNWTDAQRFYNAEDTIQTATKRDLPGRLVQALGLPAKIAVTSEGNLESESLIDDARECMSSKPSRFRSLMFY